MRSVLSTVERRFESYSGSRFSAMKVEYVVVAEQAHPLGSFPPYIIFCVLRTHAVIVACDYPLYAYMNYNSYCENSKLRTGVLLVCHCRACIIMVFNHFPEVLCASTTPFILIVFPVLVRASYICRERLFILLYYYFVKNVRHAMISCTPSATTTMN